MSKAKLFLLCITGGFCFLFGNIAYDLLDNPNSTVNYSNYFFRPLAIMIFILWVAIGKLCQDQNKHIQYFIYFFRNLSLGMVTHYFVSDATIQSISDYAFMLVCIIILLDNYLHIGKWIIKLISKRKHEKPL